MVSSPKQQYVRYLLSHSGPDKLPYAGEVLELIEEHLLNLTQDYPTLTVVPATFYGNDGTVSELLQADGTIPVTCRETVCDIPLTIWLLESYPVSAPVVIVSPENGMSIKPNHPFVSRSGLVSLPYLDDWTYPHSDLFTLVQKLRICFRNNPPLLSNADALRALSLSSTTSASPPIPQTPASASDHSSPLSAQSRSISPLGSSSSSQNLSPSSSASMASDQSFEGNYNEQMIVSRENAIKELSEHVKQGLEEHQRMRNADMRKLAAAETQLKMRHNQIMLAVDRQRNEREVLEHNLQAMYTNTDALEKWVACTRKFYSGNIDIDDVFAPCDTLSKQILENASEDFVLEDMLYHLDYAVQQGKLPMNAYLKLVRSIAREQFFRRAMAMKVAEVQRQIQIWDMAVRYPPAPGRSCC